MRLLILALLFLGVANAATAQGSNELDRLRTDAMRIPNATIREFPDFTMVMEQSGLVFHYFTKPGHFAHPGAIRRYAVQESSAWYMKYDARSFGTDSQQDDFKRWLAQFRELDRQMADHMKKQNSNPRQ